MYNSDSMQSDEAIINHFLPRKHCHVYSILTHGLLCILTHGLLCILTHGLLSILTRVPLYIWHVVRGGGRGPTQDFLDFYWIKTAKIHTCPSYTEVGWTCLSFQENWIFNSTHFYSREIRRNCLKIRLRNGENVTVLPSQEQKRNITLFKYKIPSYFFHGINRKKIHAKISTAIVDTKIFDKP